MCLLKAIVSVFSLKMKVIMYISQLVSLVLNGNIRLNRKPILGHVLQGKDGSSSNQTSLLR